MNFKVGVLVGRFGVDVWVVKFEVDFLLDEVGDICMFLFFIFNNVKI